MMLPPLEALLATADAYATSGKRVDERRLSESRISTIVFNDGQRLKKVRAGADMGGRMIQKALEWFSQHWPATAQWPDGVHKPAVAATPADFAEGPARTALLQLAQAARNTIMTGRPLDPRWVLGVAEDAMARSRRAS